MCWISNLWAMAFEPKYRKPYTKLCDERYLLEDHRIPSLKGDDDLNFVARRVATDRVREIDSSHRMLNARFSRELRRLQHKHRRKRSRQ